MMPSYPEAFKHAVAVFCNHWYGSDHGSIEYCLRQAIVAYEEVALAPSKQPPVKG